MHRCIRELNNSLLKSCDVTVANICDNALEQMRLTKHLNAFITTREEEVRREAHELDEQLQRMRMHKSSRTNPLFGIPISIKDNFSTNNLLTTCGSKMLHNYVPAYDATVVAKLKQANCVITGKTNMDEFAMGSSCTTSYYKTAANYWKRDSLAGKYPSECDDASKWFMAGGSSTGSAISVASGACLASIGTDTGGSTRQPASLCGVVGFKPTYGLISRFGLIPLAHCLDVVSILARSVDDIGFVFNQIVGQDENDLTTVDHKAVLTPARSLHERTIIRIGIPDEFVSHGELSEEVASQYSDIVKSLSHKTLGKVKFVTVKIDLPHSYLATECYTIISSAEIASNMSCYDGVKYGLSKPLDEASMKCTFDRNQFYMSNRDEGFGDEVKKRILLGNYFLLSENREKYLMQALKIRKLISDDFVTAFERDNIDLIIMPSTPTTSTSYKQWLEKRSDNKLFHEDYYLIPGNLANMPCISLPIGLSNSGMPIGLQLIARRFHDLDLLNLSRYLESW